MQLERKNALEKGIRTLTTGCGTISDQKHILDEERTHYKTLYTKPLNSCCLDDCPLFDQEFPQLKSQEIEACEAPITIEELGLALKQLPNIKSPGSDGFTSEF